MVYFLWALGVIVSYIDITHAAAAVSPSITVPLRRRSTVSGRASFDTLAAMANNLRQKYNYPTGSLNRRRGTGIVPITDENSDSSYSGELTIGTPGQTFGVILDTGSSDLWVASTSCLQGCTNVQTYSPTSSTNFKDQNHQVSITYGSGTVTGEVATDTVSIGGFSGSQTFLAATQVSPGLLDADLSGLLGLGFKSIANTGATPFVQSLADSNSLSSPLMSFYLARFINDKTAQGREPGGIFTVGATNSSLFQGNIDYVSIPSTVTPGFWLLPVTGITIGGNALTVSSGSKTGTQLAAIDTGTTLIGGPSDAVAALYAQIPGSQQGTGQLQGYYTFPCSTKVNAAFSFGGKNSWPMSPADFQLQAQANDGSVVCVGAVFDLAASGPPGNGGPPRKRQTLTNPQWIIGDSFLKNVYSVFRYDPPSVGFAQLASSLPNAGPAPGPATGGLSSGSLSPNDIGNGGQGLAVDFPSLFALLSVVIVAVSHAW